MGTTKEQRRELAENGFVRVDGLRTYRPGPVDESYIIEAVPEHRGNCDYNNGLSVIVTLDGEVWLASGPKDCHSLLRALCPNNRGAFVPCSNGETMSHHDLLARFADPNYVPRYARAEVAC